MVGAVNAGLAMRKVRDELEQGRRGHTRMPLDLHRELAELLRVEAREALQRYLVAGSEARRAS